MGKSDGAPSLHSFAGRGKAARYARSESKWTAARRDLAGKPLKVKHRSALQNHYKVLVRELDVPPALDQLYSDNVLTTEDMGRVMSEKIREDQVRTLLSIMDRKPDLGYYSLRRAVYVQLHVDPVREPEGFTNKVKQASLSSLPSRDHEVFPRKVFTWDELNRRYTGTCDSGIWEEPYLERTLNNNNQLCRSFLELPTSHPEQPANKAQPTIGRAKPQPTPLNLTLTQSVDCLQNIDQPIPVGQQEDYNVFKEEPLFDSSTTALKQVHGDTAQCTSSRKCPEYCKSKLLTKSVETQTETVQTSGNMADQDQADGGKSERLNSPKCSLGRALLGRSVSENDMLEDDQCPFDVVCARAVLSSNRDLVINIELSRHNFEDQQACFSPTSTELYNDLDPSGSLCQVQVHLNGTHGMASSRHSLHGSTQNLLRSMDLRLSWGGSAPGSCGIGSSASVLSECIPLDANQF